jgi:hypothetical protein
VVVNFDALVVFVEVSVVVDSSSSVVVVFFFFVVVDSSSSVVVVPDPLPVALVAVTAGWVSVSTSAFVHAAENETSITSAAKASAESKPMHRRGARTSGSNRLAGGAGCMARNRSRRLRTPIG